MPKTAGQNNLITIGQGQSAAKKLRFFSGLPRSFPETLPAFLTARC